MPKTNDVDVELYSDDDWLGLSAPARWVYVWAFTNHRCNMAGIYKVSLRIASTETGWSDGDVREALAELEAEGFVSYDAERRLLWVRARVKNIRGQNANVAKAIVSVLRDLPFGHPFGPDFYARYGDGLWGQGQHRGVLAAMLHEAAQHRDDWTNPRQPSAAADGPGTVPLFAATTRIADERDGLADQPSGSRPLRDPHLDATVPERRSGGEGGAGEGQPGKRPSRALRAGERGGASSDELPDGFPQHLRPTLDQVTEILERVAAGKPKALAVTPVAVARLLMSKPRKAHVDAAEEFEHYWLHGAGAPKPVRDVVATFRNRLETKPDLAAGAGGQGPRRGRGVYGGDLSRFDSVPVIKA